MSRVKVHRLAVLQDNYSYIVEDTQDHSAVVVDPAEPDPVVAFLDEHKLRPVAVWITHEHGDHTGGVEGVLARFGKLPVYGSVHAKGHIPHQDHFLNEGEKLTFAGETVQVFEVPGHAEGHIAFYLPGHVFSGDVVFGVSCGKVFSGDFGQMYRSVSKLTALPDETLVYCGHEYTMGNLKFAAHVDPDNAEVQRRLREEKPPTVPLHLGREKQTNPFMRCADPVVRQFTGQTDPVEVFRELRQRKDRF